MTDVGELFQFETDFRGQLELWFLFLLPFGFIDKAFSGLGTIAGISGSENIIPGYFERSV